jgi:hypothetical protein
VNRRRRLILLVGAGLFLLSALMPPWNAVWMGVADEAMARHFAGPWEWVWDPPQSSAAEFSIDFSRLALEWAALAVVTAALWAVAGPKKGTP